MRTAIRLLVVIVVLGIISGLITINPSPAEGKDGKNKDYVTGYTTKSTQNKTLIDVYPQFGLHHPAGTCTKAQISYLCVAENPPESTWFPGG